MAAGYVIYQGPSAIDGSPIVAIVCALKKSRNAKTGHMVQTYILRADMHPLEAVRTGADVAICGSCVHRGDGMGGARSCYVTLAHGPSHVWRSLLRGVYPVADPAEVAEVVAGRMVRLGAYGDPAAVPIEVWQQLIAKAAGHTGYTHRFKEIGREWAGLVMASADSLADRFIAGEMGFRTFRVGQERAAGEVLCPASKEAGKKTVCADCRACMGTMGKARADIVIAPHGTGARYAREREVV
jgi:hypothetical protein